MSRPVRELAGLAVLAGCAYALAALYLGRAGQAGMALAQGLRGLLGLAAGVAVASGALLGWRILRRPEPVGWLRLAAGTALLVGALALVAELARSVLGGVGPGSGPGWIWQGGGWLGQRLLRGLREPLGEAGAVVVAACALALAAWLLFSLPPGRLVGAAAWTARAAGRGAAAGLRLVARAAGASAALAGRLGGAAVRRALAGQRVQPGSARPARSAAPGAAGPAREQGGAAGLADAGDDAGPPQPPPASPPLPASSARGLLGAGRRRAAPAEPGPPGGRLWQGAPPAGLQASAEPSAAAAEAAPSGAGAAGAGRGTTGDAALSGTQGRPDGGRVWPAPVPGRWKLPSVDLLSRPPARRRAGDDREVQERSQLLERTLASFGVEARVVSYTRGPVVTRYELALPPGVKLSRVVSLVDDLALAMASTGVRIEAPVPGKPVVGVEVPNGRVEPVYLREVLEHPAFAQNPAPLALALGKDVAGQPVVGDLERLIHLLIAGATGSGKSVCLASIIMSLLFRLTPDQMRLLLIDPKRVELTVYDGVPHLLAPVVTEVQKAALALRWAVREMEQRYQQLAAAGARHLAAYNQMAARGQVEAPLPYVVVVVDELADLMMVAPAEVEDSICRLAQMARAAGIHLVIATQRPSTDVITGLIKANIPSRLAFAVSSQVDSRTILDGGGAERLLGRGDMLYHPLGEPKPVRAQGCLVTERDVEQVVQFWKAQGAPEYAPGVFDEPPAEPEADEGEDSLYEEAVRLVTQTGQASVSLLQRRFRIGYARAARLIDLMEQRGVVGPYQGSRPREVLFPHRRREHSA
ncbi:MAG TPA: DNA translocase FtsK [Limnochordales bacterium]